MSAPATAIETEEKMTADFVVLLAMVALTFIIGVIFGRLVH